MARLCGWKCTTLNRSHPTVVLMSHTFALGKIGDVEIWDMRTKSSRKSEPSATRCWRKVAMTLIASLRANSLNLHRGPDHLFLENCGGTMTDLRYPVGKFEYQGPLSEAGRS